MEHVHLAMAAGYPSEYLTPSPVDTPLSPSERAEPQANDPVGLSNLGMGTRAGYSSEQPSTGYSRPGRATLRRGVWSGSPCSFLKVLPRHVLLWDTALLSQPFSGYLSAPVCLGSPLGKIWVFVKHLSSCCPSAGSSWGCRGRGRKEC